MKQFLLTAALSCLCTAAWAAPSSVKLSVPGMNCATCPITIKKALMRVPGVSTVEVSLEKHEATVAFDDATTSIAALIQSTGKAGYPSKIAESAK